MAVVLAVGFVLALWLGPIMLVVNPLLFGVAHLLASYRFAPRAGHAEQTRALRIAFALGVAIVAAFALLRWEVPRGAVEAFALAAAGAGGPLLPVAAAASLVVLFPAIVIGTLVLAHNAIAYYYWHRATKASGAAHDLRFVALSFAALCTLSLAIALGLFDFAIFARPRFITDALLSTRLDLDATAALIAGRDASPHLLERLTVIAALGQAMHYYVWLRAIPRALGERVFARADVGALPIALTLAGGLALAALALYDLHMARSIFIVLASTHAFFEIGTLLGARRAT